MSEVSHTVVLPLLDATLSVTAALAAAEGHGAVIATDGARYWFYDASAIECEVLGADPEKPLAAIAGDALGYIVLTQAVTEGLQDLANPNAAAVQRLLARTASSLLIASIGQSPAGQRLVTAFTDTGFTLRKKEWMCPTDNTETFYNPGTCKVHKKTLVKKP